MNFSFSKKKTLIERNPFGDEDVEEEAAESTSKPFDYVKARIDSQARQARLEAMEERADFDEPSQEDTGVVYPHSSSLGPVGSLSSKTILLKPKVNVGKEGLVMMDPEKNPALRGESKHIARMKETSEVNEKFKTLLKVKIADREKVAATNEFGVAPEEIITSAYRKQREESLALEKELEANESANKKKDVANLFKEMLGSGSYSRTNFQTRPAESDIPMKKETSAPLDVSRTEVTRAMTEHVLKKIVPESTAEVSKAIEERAKQDALKIVEQISAVDQLEEDREGARMSAKERYLERKRLKLLHEQQNQ